MAYNSKSTSLFVGLLLIYSVAFAGCGIHFNPAKMTPQSDSDVSVHVQKITGIGTGSVAESNWDIASRVLRDYHFLDVKYDAVPIAAILADLNGILCGSPDAQNIRFGISPEVAMVPITLSAEDISALDLFKLITHVSNSKISQKECWLVLMSP